MRSIGSAERLDAIAHEHCDMFYYIAPGEYAIENGRRRNDYGKFAQPNRIELASISHRARVDDVVLELPWRDGYAKEACRVFKFVPRLVDAKALFACSDGLCETCLSPLNNSEQEFPLLVPVRNNRLDREVIF